jgi:copper resistance protein B
MKAAALLALVPGVMCLAAAAQDPHAGHKASPPTAPAPSMPQPKTSDDPHAGHQMPTPAKDPHAGHAMPGRVDEEGAKPATAAALAVGDASPPPVIKDNVVDTVYGAESMDRARDVLRMEHGGELVSKVMADVIELAAASGDTGYRWDVEASHGGDLHKFVFRTEGEGTGDEVDSAEVQALYSRAVGRYTDFQAGVRYDFEPDGRAYAMVGVESLFPYWFDVEGALFLSESGDAFARFEGHYDLRFTQSLILQPRVELTLAAQDVPESDIGSGFSSAEVGLRLRYDIRREFAPYIGVNFEKNLGRSADLVRSSGGEVEETSVVVGLRAWF